jgi:hypothetical protein
MRHSSREEHSAEKNENTAEKLKNEGKSKAS